MQFRHDIYGSDHTSTLCTGFYSYVRLKILILKSLKISHISNFKKQKLEKLQDTGDGKYEEKKSINSKKLL